MLGFQQFLAQDSDVTLELVEEGKEHIKREKRMAWLRRDNKKPTSWSHSRMKLQTIFNFPTDLTP